jgi:ankyrin repeat protein
MKRIIASTVAILLSSGALLGAGTEVADAVMKRDPALVQRLLQQKADVNGAQSDGMTALHWAARFDDLAMADRLISAGARVAAANRVGVTPLQIAAINGSAPMINRLLKAGANPNAPLNAEGDTVLMVAARNGTPDAVRALLDGGAAVNARENWGGTTALMWAVSEGHLAAAKVLVERGADVNARSHYVPAANGRGFEGRLPVNAGADQKVEEYASGWFTPLMFAARQGDLEMTRFLLQSGAGINELAGDGKNALAVAIFNGNYSVASLLVDHKANVNQADAQRFTPLFWAVDRRNMEKGSNGFAWVTTEDPLPLIRKLLDAGADPNAVVNNTPRSRNRGGSPRIVFASALMRAVFAGDLELSKLLLARGANPRAVSSDGESMLEAAAGLAFINGYHSERTSAERVELVRMLIELGEDVNWSDHYGITPLMAAANRGDVPVIQLLVDNGADIGAYDLGKKLDGSFHSSIEPLMAVDYAIGVGTFVPNNSFEYHHEATELLFKLMKERNIPHTTSECTLRGFTCAIANVDPKTATPAEIAKMRQIQIGFKVEGIAGGLQARDAQPNKD